jgi:cytochrome oxidase Cu insertion factor (SCO1/SenC/PrrC family)
MRDVDVVDALTYSDRILPGRTHAMQLHVPAYLFVRPVRHIERAERVHEGRMLVTPPVANQRPPRRRLLGFRRRSTFVSSESVGIVEHETGDPLRVARRPFTTSVDWSPREGPPQLQGARVMIIAKPALVFGLVAAMSVPSTAHDRGTKVTGPADNYVYQLAAAGSYRLPVIKAAPDGIVLDHTGAAHEMRELLTGHFTFLAFVYTRCGDICPLATMRLAELRDLAGSSDGGKLRLITMSFDPGHDTPERMAHFAKPWLDGNDDSPEILGHKSLTSFTHAAKSVK